MSGLTFNGLLRLEGIEPENVNVILHSPYEGSLGGLMASLVRTRRAAVEAYQALHSINAERTLSNGRPWVASFVRVASDRVGDRTRMLFIGLYRNTGYRDVSHSEIGADAEVRWLYEQFGFGSELMTGRADLFHRWFDLELTDHLANMHGRLVILARLTRSYVRLAENLDAPIAAIHELGVFDSPPPPWREIVASAAFVQEMPPGWAARLREWRGVHLITGGADGARYVGAAYGADNLLGRWRAHVAGEIGVTAELARRRTADFMFSILERVSPDTPMEEVTALEQTWMLRLHTKTHGLNR